MQSEHMIVTMVGVKAGKTKYELGDRFDVEGHKSRGELTQTSVDMAYQVGKIAPLNRENYERCMVQRPKGTIGRGFTKAQLVELGIIDADKVKTPTAEKVAVAGAEVEEYKGRLIKRVKVGGFTKFEVTNKAGELLRAARFTKTDTAKAFIDGLPPAESTES